MELRHLRYFTAVADLGTFTAAAKRLHVSQSSVSEQVADLEHELGGPLLERSSRRVRLTPMGAAFLDEARNTLAAAERALEVSRQSIRGETGTLNIGFFLWGAGTFFPRIVREYRRRRPGIRLSLLEMHAAEQVQALEERTLDVGLTRPLEPSAHSNLRSELLYRDPIVVAMRPEHPLAATEVRLASLAGQRLVLASRGPNPPLYQRIVNACHEEGFEPNIVATSTTWSGVLTLVEAGEGIALVPAGAQSLRMRGVAYAKLLPTGLSVGLSVVWNDRNVGPPLLEFLRLLRENKERIQKSGGS